MKLKLIAAAIGAAPAVGHAPYQAEPSQVEKQVEKKSQKEKRPAIYDESADAKEQIAAALAKAKKENLGMTEQAEVIEFPARAES